MIIMLRETVGEFAENKDLARKIRIEKIIPALEKKEEIILDFRKVDAATQSFIHALLSDVIRHFGNEALDHISFKNCSETVQKMITIVTDYLQESE